MSRVTSTQLTRRAVARAPTAVAPSSGAARAGPKSGARPLNASRRTRRAGRVASRRRRRRRTPAPRTCPPTSARMPGPRARRSGARPRCRPSATKGTTSRAPNRGCTPSWPASDTWAATARARCRGGRFGVAGPRTRDREHRSVVVGVGVQIEQAARRRRSRARRARWDRGPPTRSRRTPAPREPTPTPVSFWAMKLGLALPQYDYSVAGDRSRSSSRRSPRTRVLPSRAGFDSVWLSDHLFLDLAKYGGPDTRFACYEPHRDARRARARRRPGPARHARAVRSVAAGERAREGARVARPHQRWAPRRRARRGLVRTRLHRDRHGDARTRSAPRALAARPSTSSPASSAGGPFTLRRALPPRERSREPAAAGAAAAPAHLRRRQGRPVAAPRRGSGGRLEHVLDLDARRVHASACSSSTRRARRSDVIRQRSGVRSVSTRSSARTRPTSSAASSTWPTPLRPES